MSPGSHGCVGPIYSQNINDDIVFEIEFIRYVEINIDYIRMLVAKYHDSNCENMGIFRIISKTVGSDIQIRSKKELIDNFIHTVNAFTEVSRFGGRRAKRNK